MLNYRMKGEIKGDFKTMRLDNNKNTNECIFGIRECFGC